MPARFQRSLAITLVLTACLLPAGCGGGDDEAVIQPVAPEQAIELVVTSHRDGATVTRPTVRIAGIVTPGSTVSVNGRRAVTRPGAGDDPDTFALRVRLRRGRNIIRVMAVKPGLSRRSRTLVLLRRRERAEPPERDRDTGPVDPGPPTDTGGTDEGSGQGGPPGAAPPPDEDGVDPGSEQGGPGGGGGGQGGPGAPGQEQGGPPAPAPPPPGQGAPPAPER